MLVVGILCGVLALGGCSPAPSPAANPATASLHEFPTSDMSGYECSKGYASDYQFVDMTVKDVIAQMDEGKSFVLFVGFQDCGWCNVLLNHLNDQAIEHGVKVGYIDTRKNPSWKSNTDITDYDLLVERFGTNIGQDDDGKARLYVPVVLFIKDGALASTHAGTVPSQQNPDDPLSDQQISELKNALKAGMDSVC